MADTDCYRCGEDIDPVNDDHYRVEFERRPVPGPDDMDIDDWFTPGVYVCASCVRVKLGFSLS